MARADLSQQARREVDARGGYARQDMAFGLASFVRPVVRGKRTYIEGVKQEWMGGTLLISGPELDAGDLGVLLALLALTLGRLPECGSHPGAEVSGLLPDAGQRPGTNRAAAHSALTLRTSMAEVCRELGRDPDDGRAHTAIRASVRRLASIVIDGSDGAGGWALTHLVRGGAGRGRGAVEVVLSFRLAWAVLGNGPHARVHMDTWRRLSPIAQVLYHWLCAWRPGHGCCPPVALDTLAGHVWGDAGEGKGDGATRRRRRQQIRQALSDLADLPSGEWEIEDAGRVVRITRNPCF